MLTAAEQLEEVTENLREISPAHYLCRPECFRYYGYAIFCIEDERGSGIRYLPPTSTELNDRKQSRKGFPLEESLQNFERI